jgi:predicted MPP superfamily phosphohydrolase
MSIKDKSKDAAAAAICAAAASATALWAMSLKLTVTHYSLRSDKLREKLRLALVTDLHSGHYGKGQKVLLDAVEREEPDIMLLGGDICDRVRSDDGADEFILAAVKLLPCYFAAGNHEFKSGRVAEIKRRFAEDGVVVLEGEMRKATVRGQSINICGVDDPRIDFYPDSGRCFLSELDGLRSAVSAANAGADLSSRRDVQGVFDSPYSVLIAHRPEYIRTYASCGFDLVVSGHAHGGQWRLPGFMSGVFAPGQGIRPEYTGGCRRVGNTDFIVSRGLSRLSPPVPRFFNPPELVVIDLLPG